MKVENKGLVLPAAAALEDPELVWMNCREVPFEISGIRYDEEQKCYVRMPQSIADQTSDGVSGLNKHTAGGRVRFRTDSKKIAICAVMENKEPMSHMTLQGQSGFDLYRSTPYCANLRVDQKYSYFCRSFRMGKMDNGYAAAIDLDGKNSTYCINFPLYDGVKELYIGLKENSSLESPMKYRNEKPVIYYGSSITQGGCASRPGNAYQAMISQNLGIEYVNLGFSGSCRAEDVMIDYLAGLEMSVFVCDYDHNTFSNEHLAETHPKLYQAIRSKQPDLPIVFMTAPDFRSNAPLFASRRDIIRKTYDDARENGDQHVYFVDGESFFEGEQWDSGTVDGCHPNDYGFACMKAKLQPVLAEILFG